MANVKLKLLYVLTCLYESDERHTLNATQIVKRLSKEYGITTERKSVCRDIATLKSFGHDIIADPDKRRGWYYGKRRFSTWQIRLFIDALAAAAFIPKNEFSRLANKLIENLGPDDKDMFERAIKPICNTRKVIDSKIKDVLEEILNSVALDRAIEFQIYTYNKTFKHVLRRGSKVYKADPYALFMRDNQYYLVGVMEGEKELRCFRLDRIANPHTTGTKRRSAAEVLNMGPAEADKKITDFTQTAFHCDSDVTYETVAISFDAKDEDMVNVFVDRFGLPESVLERDGRVYATLKKLYVSTDIRNWLQTYADKFTVTYPKELQKDIAASLKKLAKSCDNVETFCPPESENKPRRYVRKAAVEEQEEAAEPAKAEQPKTAEAPKRRRGRPRKS